MDSNKQNDTGIKSDGLPACAAEFIKMVIKKMHYSRRAGQEVEAELAAHFQDELKNCATGGIGSKERRS